ncbi:hypothetical protein HDU99_006365 [Rhizoclosmatium hyalinum]|nr:hypothetical protein HDU99_006365 [Rhizoclosmatium hyalinum]
MSIARRFATVTRIARRHGSSGHGHDHGHEAAHKVVYVRNKETPAAWLKIAREWPHEYYAPPHGEQPESLLTYPDHPDGSETQSKRETFFSSYFLKAGVLVAASVFAIQSLQQTKKDENPITKYISENMRGRDGIESDMQRNLAIQQRIADDTRILTNGAPQTIHRLYFPGIFERSSDFLIEPGSQSPVTGSSGTVEIKYSWQKDDDLFGLPYPKDE